MNDARQPSPGSPVAVPTLHYDAIELAGEESSLLLPPGVLGPGWRYVLSVGQRWDFIRMQRCSKCGLDFEQIAFTLVKARQAA